MFITTGIKIDNVDITPYIAFQGVKWSRNDIDGPNAGRNIQGDMIRDRVATKIRLDITCRQLKSNEMTTLMNLLLPESVQVAYEDPLYGSVTKTMYANNHGANFLMHWANGTEWWENVTFPLIEV